MNYNLYPLAYTLPNWEIVSKELNPVADTVDRNDPCSFLNLLKQGISGLVSSKQRLSGLVSNDLESKHIFLSLIGTLDNVLVDLASWPIEVLTYRVDDDYLSVLSASLWAWKHTLILGSDKTIRMSRFCAAAYKCIDEFGLGKLFHEYNIMYKDESIIFRKR